MSSNLRYIFNLGNSIIGVGVLAMPYCFSQCGILLSVMLLFGCNLLTRVTCYLLMKSSHLTRRKSFESLAFHTFGAMGKLMVEISMIGFLIGCLIAFFVVMGDLGPEVVSHLTGVEKSSGVRTIVLVFLGLFVILPFSLLRKLDSLTVVSVISLIFYVIFVLKILFQSLPNLWASEWINSVRFWNTGGVLTCLPIFSMALSCQTQFFEIYNIVPDPSIKKMSSIVTGAVNLCTSIYILVGFLGYIAFYNVEMKGNFLTMFPSSLVTEAVRLGFVLTVAMSFPLVIFPCRASIHSLICGKGTGSVIDSAAKMIPDNQFRIITFSIVFGTWLIGVLIPNIELVLGLNGSTVGTIICVILPTIMFIKVVTKNTNDKLMAQVVFGIGVFVLVASTYATLQNADRSARSNLERMEQNLLVATKKGPLDNIVELPVTAKKLDVKYSTNLSQNINNIHANNSKKEPPIPNEPKQPSIVKDEKSDDNKVNVEKVNGGEKSKDAEIMEKDALIKKLAEQQKQQEQIIKQQKEILEDIKQHHEKHELIDKEQAKKVSLGKNDKSTAEKRRTVVGERNSGGEQRLVTKEVAHENDAVQKVYTKSTRKAPERVPVGNRNNGAPSIQKMADRVDNVKNEGNYIPVDGESKLSKTKKLDQQNYVKEKVIAPNDAVPKEVKNDPKIKDAAVDVIQNVAAAHGRDDGAVNDPQKNRDLLQDKAKGIKISDHNVDESVKNKPQSNDNILAPSKFETPRPSELVKVKEPEEQVVAMKNEMRKFRNNDDGQQDI